MEPAPARVVERPSPWPPEHWGPHSAKDLKARVQRYTVVHGYRTIVSKDNDGVIHFACADHRRSQKGSCPVHWRARRRGDGNGWDMVFDQEVVAKHLHELDTPEVLDVGLVYIAIPNPGNSLDPHVCVTVPVELDHLSKFRTAAVQRLQSLVGLTDALGPSFLQQTGDEVWHCHQLSVVTALATEPGPGLSLVLNRAINWNKEVDAKRLQELIIAERAKCAHLVLFVPRDCFPSEGTMTLGNFYDAAEEVLDIYRGIRVYPSRHEGLFADRKLGDIAELDRIARVTQAWRPRTCLGMGPCSLPPGPARTVSKRTFSCGAGHVKTIEGGARDPFLTCQLPPQPPQKTSSRGSHQRRKTTNAEGNGEGEEGRWFHQEYVDSFRSWGEVRVFISGGGIGTGQILGAVHSKFDEGGALLVDAFQPSSLSFLEPGARDAKAADLHRFALATYAALLASKNPGFASLDVGCRLDIGISRLSGEGQWFVGEITRWWAADDFSWQTLPYPHLGYCQVFANSFRVSLALDMAHET